MRRNARLVALVAFTVGAAVVVAPQTVSASSGITVGMGYVRDASGNPIPDAFVAVRLWGDDTNTAVGEAANILNLAIGTTDDSGFFRVEVSDPALLGPFVAETIRTGGFANLQLEAQAGDLYFTTFYSIGPNGESEARWSRPIDGMTRKPLRPRVITLAPGATGVTRLDSAFEGYLGRIPLGATSRGPSPRPPCLTWVLQQNLTPVWGPIGEMHRWGAALPTTSFEYGATANSDIDVGFSSNSGSTWGINGSVHVGNSSGAAVSTAVTQSQTYTGYKPEGEFRRAEYAQVCTFNKKRQATTWVTGSIRRGNAVSGLDGLCDTTYSAYAFHFSPSTTSARRNTGTAQKWSQSFSLGPIFVGMRSGFATNADILFDFTNNSNQNKWLCGNNSGWSVAPRVYAGV